MRLLSSLWSVNITRIEPAGTQVRPLELCWLMKTLAVSLRCSHIDIWCLCIDTISVHKNILISYCYDILINIYEYFKLCTNKIRIKYPTFIQVYSHIAYMGIYLFFFFFLRKCLMIIQMSWKKQSKIKSTHTVTQTIAPSA